MRCILLLSTAQKTTPRSVIPFVNTNQIQKDKLCVIHRRPKDDSRRREKPRKKKKIKSNTKATRNSSKSAWHDTAACIMPCQVTACPGCGQPGLFPVCYTSFFYLFPLCFLLLLFLILIYLLNLLIQLPSSSPTT